jgi:hypothetical protein
MTYPGDHIADTEKLVRGTTGEENIELLRDTVDFVIDWRTYYV